MSQATSEKRSPSSAQWGYHSWGRGASSPGPGPRGIRARKGHGCGVNAPGTHLWAVCISHQTVKGSMMQGENGRKCSPAPPTALGVGASVKDQRDPAHPRTQRDLLQRPGHFPIWPEVVGFSAKVRTVACTWLTARHSGVTIPVGIRRGLCLVRQVFRHPGLDTRLAGTGLVCFEVGIQWWTCRVGAPHPREWGPGPALTEGQGGPPGPPHLLSLLTYPQVGWLRLTPEPLNPHLTCTLHLCGSRCPAPLPRSWEQSRTPSHPHPRGRAGWGQRLCSGTLSADPSCCEGRQHAPPLIHPSSCLLNQRAKF